MSGGLNLKSEFDEVYGAGMGRWVLEKGATLLLARGQSAPALLASLENALKERIVSEYRGYYSCAQGMTNLTIQLLSPESGSPNELIVCRLLQARDRLEQATVRYYGERAIREAPTMTVQIVVY